MFNHAKQNRTFEDVISQIQEAIIRGELKPGDRLPSERNLREVFKVSRSTLREAFRSLEQKGLITIKVGMGGGAIVCSADTKRMSESLDLLLKLQKVSIIELIEFRETVEGVVAAKAALNASEDDLKELACILGSIENHLDTNEVRWNEVVREDHSFHLALARIAGNRVFESVLCTIYQNINRYFDQFMQKKYWVLENNYKDLCKIAEAIRKKDAKEAELLAKKHVKLFKPMIEESEKQFCMWSQNLDPHNLAANYRQSTNDYDSKSLEHLNTRVSDK